MQKRIALLIVPIFTLTLFAAADRPARRLRHRAIWAGGKTIKTDYSSPRMKGRKIYGGS